MPAVPSFSLYYLLSAPAAFSVRLVSGRTGSQDIGAAVLVRNDFRCEPAQMKQAAPGAACWKKKIGDQSEP